MKIWIYSGRPSKSAALLHQAGFSRMYKGGYWQKGDVVINWGNGDGVPVGDKVLNHAENIMLAINKKVTFQILAGENVSTVPWTANMAVAQEWLNAGDLVVVRKTLTGYDGAGIILIQKGEKLPDAPLYTKYVDKVKEFRVHATRLGVIDTQWKVRDPEQEPKSWKIRTYANGFIFQRKGVQPSAARDALAVAGLNALGLDFGGLDICEDKFGNFYIIEINTAPGIDGSDIDKYVTALTELATKVS